MITRIDYRIAVGMVALAFGLCLRSLGVELREYHVRSWTREDGLPGSTVTAVAQTPDGYLWVSTFSELARFDGVRFKVFSLEEVPGFNNSPAVDLIAGHKGDLWVCASDGHIARFHEGRFFSLPRQSEWNGFPLRHRLAEGRDGKLWALDRNGLLSCSQGEQLEPYALDAQVKAGGLTAVAADGSGGVWLIGASTLVLATNGGSRVVWDADQEPGFKPEALAPARQGGCWVAANDRVRRYQGGRWVETRGPLAWKRSIWGFLEDRAGTVWVGLYGGGLAGLGPDGSVKWLTRAEGLASDMVRCLCEDREGNLWAGFEGKGLARIRRAMFSSFDPPSELAGEVVLCVCEGAAGEMWLGSNGNGIRRLKGGQIRRYGEADGLDNECVWAVHRDRAGRIWAGTWGGGLYRFEGDRFAGVGSALGFADVVVALHEDRQGSLWLGQLVPKDRVVEALVAGRRRSLPAPGPGPGIEVRSIAETPDGAVFFGLAEGGLLRWNGGVFRQYGVADGLPPGPIGTMQVDHSGALWLGVAGVGLVLFSSERFALVTMADGLPSKMLTQITEDGLGYLWCGSREGVFRVKLEDLRARIGQKRSRVDCKLFTKADGLPNNECSGGGCRTRDGRIWFSTMDGVAIVDPRCVQSNPRPPTVLVEELLWDDQPLFNTTRQPQADPWRIGPGRGRLELRYTALCFAAPESVRFRYRLAGLDSAWVEAGGQRSAAYAYLPPGDYTFQVTACNEDGVWNAAGASMAFTILPHFWQRSWFSAGVVLVLLGAAGMVARVSATRRFRRQLARLEQQRALERERRRIARDLHDDLGSGLTEILLMGEAAEREAASMEEATTRTRQMTGKIRQIVGAMDQIVWTVNPENDSLPNLADYLSKYAQEFFSATQVRCRLDVMANLPDVPLTAQARHNLFLAAKEAMHNVAKHSAAGEVWLRIQCEADVLCLAVEDNGHGFDPAVAPAGDGLQNMRERLRSVGGRVELSRRGEQGTSVRFHFPLPAAGPRRPAHT